MSVGRLGSDADTPADAGAAGADGTGEADRAEAVGEASPPVAGALEAAASGAAGGGLDADAPAGAPGGSGDLPGSGEADAGALAVGAGVAGAFDATGDDEPVDSGEPDAEEPDAGGAGAGEAPPTGFGDATAVGLIGGVRAANPGWADAPGCGDATEPPPAAGRRTPDCGPYRRSSALADGAALACEERAAADRRDATPPAGAGRADIVTWLFDEARGASYGSTAEHPTADQPAIVSATAVVNRRAA